MKDEQIRIRVTKEFKEKFKKHCKNNNIDMSALIVYKMTEEMRKDND